MTGPLPTDPVPRDTAPTDRAVSDPLAGAASRAASVAAGVPAPALAPPGPAGPAASSGVSFPSRRERPAPRPSVGDGPLESAIESPTAAADADYGFAAAIRAAVAPEPVPFVGVWERATSTNDLARAAAADIGPGLAAGSVFLADRQTAGRGRFGRRWRSPPGGLYLSLLVAAPPEEAGASPAAAFSRLPLAAGLAAAEAVERAVGLRPALRWPNDLDLDGGKVGGVLLETGLPAPPPPRRGRPAPPAPPLAIVGFGINLGPVSPDPASGEEDPDAPPPIRPPAWLPRWADRARLAAELTAAFHRRSREAFRDPAALAARWEAASPTARGARCRVRLAEGREASGRTAGLAPDGAIRVRLESGALLPIHASDAISFVPAPGRA